jgi:hypothetical protein
VRQLSPTIQENLFTTVAMSKAPSFLSMAIAPKNVFNNKADFKVLLPESDCGPA